MINETEVVHRNFLQPHLSSGTVLFLVSGTVPLPAPAVFPLPLRMLSQSLNIAFHEIPLLPDNRYLDYLDIEIIRIIPIP